jgi:hypothetical protein
MVSFTGIVRRLHRQLLILKSIEPKRHSNKEQTCYNVDKVEKLNSVTNS